VSHPGTEPEKLNKGFEMGWDSEGLRMLAG
jgi:hypothetical protein